MIDIDFVMCYNSVTLRAVWGYVNGNSNIAYDGRKMRI